MTENGWPSCGTDQLDYGPIPGTGIALPLQIGYPNTIMKAFAADFNLHVESLVGHTDIGGWTATNSVATSNHLGGTAMDLNWNSHPFHVSGTFGERLPALRALLDWYEGLIYWGGDWSDPIDEMHFQMGYQTFGDDARLQDFINRKIRPDWFSTYQTDSLEDFMATNQEKLDFIYDKLSAYKDAGLPWSGHWPSRARCRRNNDGVDDTVGMGLFVDANVYDLLVAWSAVTVGDKAAIDTVNLGASGQLPANDPASVAWFRAVQSKIAK